MLVWQGAFAKPENTGFCSTCIDKIQWLVDQQLKDLFQPLRQHALDARGVQVSLLQLGLQIDNPQLRQFADLCALQDLHVCWWVSHRFVRENISSAWNNALYALYLLALHREWEQLASTTTAKWRLRWGAWRQSACAVQLQCRRKLPSFINIDQIYCKCTCSVKTGGTGNLQWCQRTTYRRQFIQLILNGYVLFLPSYKLDLQCNYFLNAL